MLKKSFLSGKAHHEVCSAMLKISDNVAFNLACTLVKINPDDQKIIEEVVEKMAEVFYFKFMFKEDFAKKGLWARRRIVGIVDDPKCISLLLSASAIAEDNPLSCKKEINVLFKHFSKERMLEILRSN